MTNEFMVFAARVLAGTLRKALKGLDAYADDRQWFYAQYVCTHHTDVVWC